MPRFRLLTLTSFAKAELEVLIRDGSPIKVTRRRGSDEAVKTNERYYVRENAKGKRGETETLKAGNERYRPLNERP